MKLLMYFSKGRRHYMQHKKKQIQHRTYPIENTKASLFIPRYKIRKSGESSGEKRKKKESI